MRLYVRAVAMTNSSKVICSSFDGAHIRVAAAEEGAEGEDVDCEDVNITEADIAPVRARRRTSLGQPRRADLAYGSRFGVRPGARKARHNWNDRLARAGVKGYRGVRATGDTRWLGKKKEDWAHWCDFEDGMNEVFRALASSWAIANQRLAMLCTYPLEGCRAPQILDVVRTHQFVLARRYGNWDILETAGLKQAKAEIQRLNDELEHRVVERTNQLMVASENLREAQAELAHVNRITAMGQLAASIVHETLQPISATVTNAHAALRWLSAESPDMEEVRQALNRIVKDGNRASDVIGRLRALSKKTPPQKDSLAINDAVVEVIAVTRGELVKNGISLQTQLGDGLPIIQADRVQLQQVILNLIINAVEAMNGVDQGSRELLVATAKDAACGACPVLTCRPG
jgi:signal transduction histidine kinase